MLKIQSRKTIRATNNAVKNITAAVIPQVALRFGQRTMRSSVHEPLKYRATANIGTRINIRFFSGWTTLVTEVLLEFFTFEGTFRTPDPMGKLNSLH